MFVASGYFSLLSSIYVELVSENLFMDASAKSLGISVDVSAAMDAKVLT